MVIGAASWRGEALRQHLLEAALFFAVIEAFFAVVEGDGWRLAVGVVVGLVCLALTGWVIRRRYRARQQYLALLTVFAVLVGSMVVVVG